MSDTLRVGVIGAGAIAQVAHLNVLGKLAETEIAGICDIDVGKAQALASRFGVRDVYDDIEDLLRYGQLDAVAVCTPNHLHEVHVQLVVPAARHDAPVPVVELELVRLAVDPRVVPHFIASRRPAA